MERIHIIISGLVQGVGFRFSTRACADSLGIVGWVRNTSEGGVEAIAEGKTAAIQNFLAWCHQGPRSAKVNKVEIVEKIKIENLTFLEFEVRV